MQADGEDCYIHCKIRCRGISLAKVDPQESLILSGFQLPLIFIGR